MAPNNKKRKHETLEELLARPWCYYCERDFEDLKVLTDHQKAKHFQCHADRCHRKLTTVNGLKVHMQQVHKEELLRVPNAIEGRDDVNLEIFGMYGIPQPVLDAYKRAVTEGYESHAHKFRKLTGNFLPGSVDPSTVVGSGAAKGDTPEQKAAKKAELQRRKEAILAKKKALAEGKPVPVATATTPPDGSKPPSGTPPAVPFTSGPGFMPPTTGVFAPLDPGVGAPGFPPSFQPQGFPPGMPQMPQMPPTPYGPPGYGHPPLPPTYGVPVTGSISPVGLPAFPPPGVRGPSLAPGYPPVSLPAPGPVGFPGMGFPPVASSPMNAGAIHPLPVPVVKQEPVIKHEPVIKQEPVVKHDPVIKQEPDQAKITEYYREMVKGFKIKTDKNGDKAAQPLSDNVRSYEEGLASSVPRPKTFHDNYISATNYDKINQSGTAPGPATDTMNGAGPVKAEG